MDRFAALCFLERHHPIQEFQTFLNCKLSQQTGPLLDQILRKGHGGQDYIIQITDARPDTGGLSGATLQEGKSWGKVQDSHNDLVTIYADATIAFPILALYALSNQKPRKHKRLYKKLDKYFKTLQSDVIKVPDKFAKLLKESNINLD
jgi:deoxyhypusine synthase